jgi:Tol biopolymer transport system component
MSRTSPLTLTLLLISTPCAALAGSAVPVSQERQANAMDPRLSPDGRRLSFEVSHAQEKYTELFVVAAEGGTEETVQPSASAGGLGGRFLDRKQVNHEFAWAPNGQLWAFSSSGTDDDFDIWVRGVTVPLGGEEKEGGAAFSADGRHLVWCSASTGDGDLYLADIYSLEKPPTRLTTSPGLDFYAAFSPAGGKLAYAAMTEDGANIHVIEDLADPAGSDRALTRWKSNQLKPSWAPDGRSLAFFSNHHREQGFDLYVVDLAGGAPRRIASGVVPNERRGPPWTPDGTEIIAVLDDPNAGDPLVRVPVRGGAVVPVDAGTVNNAEPAVAPVLVNGRIRVAFVAQGLKGDKKQDWRRVWRIDLPAAK